MKRASVVNAFIFAFFPGRSFAIRPPDVGEIYGATGNLLLDAISPFGMVLSIIFFIYTAFNIMAKFNAARHGRGDFSSVGFSAIIGMIPLAVLTYFLMPSEKIDVTEGIQVLPEITEGSVGFGYLLSVFVIVLIMVGAIIYLANKDKPVPNSTLKNEESNKIDRRFYQLKNKSKKLAERCKKEAIDGFSFITLSAVSDELIELLKNNKSYLNSRGVNKFLNSNINIYLKFLDEYESIMGYFDEVKRSTVEDGVLDMIASIEEISQSIVDDRYLGIDVKKEVIELLRKS